jgi:DNA repair protein RadC
MKATYTRTFSVPVIRQSDIAEKQYVLTIRDLPNESKPREKLLRDGAALLSMAELLAVVLNVGSKKEDILAMSNRILKEYGEKSITNIRNPKELSKDLDISLGRASQLVAMVELGRRLFERNPNGGKVIRTAKDVYTHSMAMAELPKEHLRGIYLNSHYKIIHDEVISIGTIDANIIHPREVYKPALEYSAAAVVLVHNHPSGILKASNDDLVVTKQLIDAGKLLGIELIDHVIVSRNGFKSIIEESR